MALHWVNKWINEWRNKRKHWLIGHWHKGIYYGVIFDRQYFLKTAKFHMDINAFIYQSPNYFDTTCIPIENLFPLHLNSQKYFSESWTSPSRWQDDIPFWLFQRTETSLLICREELKAALLWETMHFQYSIFSGGTSWMTAEVLQYDSELNAITRGGEMWQPEERSNLWGWELD